MKNSETEANRQVIREAFEAWKHGTGDITDVFAPEMIWRIEGHSLASKEYNNKQQFIDEVLSPFGARFASSSDPFHPVRIRSVHADGDTVIVLWDGRGIANDGQPYEEQLRLVHEDERRQSHRRHRLLRQHLVQRTLEPSATALAALELTSAAVADSAILGNRLREPLWRTEPQLTAMLPAESRAGRLDEWLHTTANSTPCSSTRNKGRAERLGLRAHCFVSSAGTAAPSTASSAASLSSSSRPTSVIPALPKLEKHVLGWSTAKYV
jgi:uncharacterized protein